MATQFAASILRNPSDPQSRFPIQSPANTEKQMPDLIAEHQDRAFIVRIKVREQVHSAYRYAPASGIIRSCGPVAAIKGV